ncbi:MAG: NADH-quinone oxidoreductase subunit C [Spirochaetales bacterium]|nr:NADH-quinone oxidoreductase subunit C [Spirochaetales bacterium]
MNRQAVLKSLSSRFQGDILDVFDKSPRRVFMEIKPSAVVPIARYVFRDLGARFNIATGTDMRTHMEILYHFTFEEIDLLVSLRVKLSAQKPEIESLTPISEAFNWIEREMAELLGINFRGHPEMKRLLLSKAWPEKVHPLRRDYKEWDKNAVRNRGLT